MLYDDLKRGKFVESTGDRATVCTVKDGNEKRYLGKKVVVRRNECTARIRPKAKVRKRNVVEEDVHLKEENEFSKLAGESGVVDSWLRPCRGRLRGGRRHW